MHMQSAIQRSDRKRNENMRRAIAAFTSLRVPIAETISLQNKPLPESALRLRRMPH
jgi:hypothetical protein